MNTLTNKSIKSYDYICRYQSFPYFYNNEDEKYIYGTTSQLDKSISYVAHQVKTEDTFDSLSLYYYNSPLYFWVIMDFNSIQDPFYELKKGQVLRIPTLNGIKFEGV